MAAGRKVVQAVSSQRDERVSAYIGKAAAFAQPILAHLRELVHEACPQVQETLKWGAPSFSYRGRILCGMAAFRQHAAFGFWQGSRVVGPDGDRVDGAMGQFGRLTRVSDLPGKRELRAYVREAMRLIDEGAPAPRRSVPKPPPAVPADLAAALADHPQARACFEGFPPGQQREYVEWLTDAKRPETRERRLRQAVEWLAEGKPRNWKYMKREPGGS